MLVMKPIKNLIITNEKYDIKVTDPDFLPDHSYITRSDIEFYMTKDKYLICKNKRLLLRIKHLNELPWAITHLQQFEFRVKQGSQTRIRKYGK